MIITTAQLLVIVAYVGYIYKKYGVLTSISASSYRVGYWFYLWLLVLGGLNLAQGMEGWGFATTAGLAFSGITIDHESSGAHQDKVHYTGTVLAIVSAFVGLIVLHGMWLPTVLFLIGVGLLYKRKNFIWEIEIVAFTLIIASYYIK